MKKKIPYTVANLEKIRQQNYFFVDKTAFIEALEEYEVPVFLRPRRFGKTLWCSVLQCYYDINRKEDFNFLFNDLYIGKNPTPLRNSFLVLKLNFSVVDVGPDLKKIEKSFNSRLNLVIKSFLADYKQYFKDVSLFFEENSLTEHLLIILQRIHEYKLPPLYLIIDEYDNFTNQLITGQQDDLYYHLTTSKRGGDSFFRTFFKVIKDGVESRTIGKVFITGVLPITIDDLTSGFNIAEIVTLKKSLHNMLGFTQVEVEAYVQDVFDIYGFPGEEIPSILNLLKNYYNGYAFLPEAKDKLYNSTILTYFLKSLVMDDGEIPRDMIDGNLRTDLSWIKRLTEKKEQTMALVEKLMTLGKLSYYENDLTDKFNMARFFEPGFYANSLFYLGMLTRYDEFHMNFPNQTVKEIFAGYYFDLLKITGIDQYVSYFKKFIEDGDLEKVFAGYWQTYIAQIPAQAFDKMNENFFRISFFELCNRYLRSRFTFAIEANYPTGRSDLEILGRKGSGFDNKKYLVEFKYFTNKDAKKNRVLDWETPKKAELDQIGSYEKEILAQFPEYTITKAIIYVAGNKGFKYFNVLQRLG